MRIYSRPMNISHEIGAIERSLKTAGVSVDTFCARVGVNRSTWQRWKAGNNSPSIKTWGVVMAHAALMRPLPIKKAAA